MVEKFQKILERIVDTKGDVVLLGIFKMDDITEKWSVIIAANWISQENRDDCFLYVSSIIQEELSEEETSKIARIGIFDSSAHLVKLLLDFKSGSEIKERQINGNTIHHGFILASNKEVIEQEALFS